MPPVRITVLNEIMNYLGDYAPLNLIKKCAESIEWNVIEEERVRAELNLLSILEVVKIYDKYKVPGVNGGQPLIDYGSVMTLFKARRNALQRGKDIWASGASSCCSASVSDPSGEGIEGRCTDCGEMCEIVREEQ